MTKPESTWEENIWVEQIDLCFQAENPREQITRYIRSLLLSQRQATIQEVREMVEGMKKLEIQDAAREQDYARQRVVGYNRALVDLASNLTDLK